MYRLLIPVLLSLSLPVLAARWSEPEVVGLVTHPAMAEISGLAPAREHPGLYWAINDSGNPAELHLLDDRGQYRASVPVQGVRNIDWEDLAGFEFEGRSYLLIADTGDNGGIRDNLVLHVVEEPVDLDQPAKVAWSLRFRWPDGPRDCEAAVVDAARGEILLISKKRVPAELFRLPMAPSEDPVTAELVGTLPGIEQPTPRDLEQSPVYGRYRSQITAADLSPNGRVMAVLNYRAIYFLVRGRGDDWGPALAADRLPHLVLPWMPQAEAIAFSLDGQVLTVASEQLPSPIVRYRIERPAQPIDP